MGKWGKSKRTHLELYFVFFELFSSLCHIWSWSRSFFISNSVLHLQYSLLWVQDVANRLSVCQLLSSFINILNYMYFTRNPAHLDLSHSAYDLLGHRKMWMLAYVQVLGSGKFRWFKTHKQYLCCSALLLNVDGGKLNVFRLFTLWQNVSIAKTVIRGH